MTLERLIQRTIRWSENDWLNLIVDLAQRYGYVVHHQRPARVGTDGKWRDAIVGTSGFPDLVMAKDGRLIIWELKLKGNTLTPHQQRWGDELSAADAEYDVIWLPPRPDSELIDGLIARLR